MPDSVERPGTWRAKFACAIRGVGLGVAGQSSFLVHGAAALAVAGLALLLSVSPLEWCVLLLCIAVVITAELLNSAVEFLARAVTDKSDPLIGAALDTSSGAVLAASLLAALIGAVIFVPKLLALWPA